jgi:O-acetyl-ADP-ribose deacetylase (regulator of RNase III)
MIEIQIAYGDITESDVDAVIYSTNPNLLLSGGVGKALVTKFGQEIQERLAESAAIDLRNESRLGAVVSCKVASMPWRLLLHTVVTDDTYTTDPDIVRSALIRSLDICDQSYGVHSIAVSALGCGYGDLPHSKFMDILKVVVEQYAHSDLRRITVVCNNHKYIEQLKKGL